MKSKAFSIIMVFSFLIASCSPTNGLINPKPSVIAWENLQKNLKNDNTLCTRMLPEEIDTFEKAKQTFPPYGLTVGFQPEDLSTSSRIANETFWVNSNEEIKLDWLFWYPIGNDEPANLRLFVLLDEHQLDHALPEPGKYNDITLERGADLTLKVKIPPLEPGVHDIIAIGIPFPENEPDEYGITVIISKRITLIVEPASSQFRKIVFSPLLAEGTIKNNDPLLTLDLTIQPDGIEIWNWPDPWLNVQENTSATFYALAGHQDVNNLDAPLVEPLEESFFALLFFVDYQQVEVVPGQPVSYNKADKDNAYGRIPLQIPPLPEGKHRILVLRIDTPGVPFCVLKGDPGERILPFSIYGRLVGVDVKSK